MDIISVITATAFLLVAIGIGHRGNGSWVILAGFALGIGAVIARLWSGGGFIQVIIELLRDGGISLLLAAAYMGFRKLAENVRPFVILGVASLVLSGLLFGAKHLWQSIWHQTEQSVLVELGPDDSILEIEGILDRFAETWERAFPELTLAEDVDLAQVYLISVSSRRAEAMISALRADTENVDHVELNVEISLSLPPSDRVEHQSGSTVLGNDPHLAGRG